MKLAIRLLISVRVSGPEKWHGPLAQLVEQVTLNHQVEGSSPSRLTNPSPPKVQEDANQKYQSLEKKYHFLKNQPAKRGQAGSLFACPTSGRDYNNITDNGDATLPLIGPLTLRDSIVLNNANETDKPSLAAPSTLPEYVMGVMP